MSKLLLGMLVLSFGIWGIGDVFRGGGSSNAIATVEGASITDRELNNLIDLLKKNYDQITPEAVSDPFFKLEVLNSLINDRLLRNEADAMGLSFSKDILARLTARNPMFQKEDGTFDRKMFLLTLEQNHHTEQSYLHKLRDEMARSMLQDTMQQSIAAPEAMAELYDTIRNEEREATLLMITSSDVEAPATPDDATLQAYFDQHAEMYMNPEYRTMRYVSFNAESVWKLLNLDPKEDVLKALYEERKDSFAKPEARTVDQLIFKTEATAKAAYDKIKSGSSFDEFADSEDITNKDSITLGNVTRNELPPATVDTVFSLAEGDYSQPVKSSFGWHIFKVSHIIPAKPQSFEDVKAHLQFDYRAEHGEEQLTQVGNQIEDALAGGATLEEALKQVGLEKLSPKTLGPLSAKNHPPKGDDHGLSKLEQSVLDTGFTLDEGQASSLSISNNADYYIVQLSKVTPSQLKPLAEVKGELVKAFKKRELEDRIKKLALETAAELKNATDGKEAFAKSKLHSYKSGRLKRSHDTVTNNTELKNKVLTSGFVLELFNLQPGQITGAYPLPSGEYVIGLLNTIHPAKGKSSGNDVTSVKKELETALPDELMQHYLNYLRNKYAVSIRQDRLFGSSEQK